MPKTLLVVALAAGLLTAGAGSAAPAGLVSIGAGLRGPKGLQASVYAKGLRLQSAYAFDARGRLWVAVSGATAHGSDGVFLVAKAGARPVKVMGGIRGPLGLVWSGGTLYVASLGRVEAFSGLHGTRFGSRRTILEGPVAGGENNNLVLAPGGRLLMGVSSTCDHCRPASRWAATIVSFRRDGSDLRVYARRIRAAFGLAYYPGTSDLFVTMNQRDDLGARTPGDWLAVVRQGQSWGFPACYGQGGAACKGVPKPVAVLGKHAAAGGIAIVTGQLGSAAGTWALVAEWQLGVVQRVELTRSGSAYTGSVSRFLAGLKNPLPLIVTRDGALLVGDWSTGTIYRITAS
jgi:glucose/arabinose dehydrogenase